MFLDPTWECGTGMIPTSRSKTFAAVLDLVINRGHQDMMATLSPANRANMELRECWKKESRLRLLLDLVNVLAGDDFADCVRRSLVQLDEHTDESQSEENDGATVCITIQRLVNITHSFRLRAAREHVPRQTATKDVLGG